MDLCHTYAGTVEATDDPEQLGRVKVRVTAVYGPANAARGSIATNDLPWALPAGLPAGGSGSSGAIAWLPSVGDHVFVRFLDGEPEKPLWEWGGQDRAQAKKFGYWRRDNGGYGKANKAPESALLTRYGHSIDFSPIGLTAVTATGYTLQLFSGSVGADGYVLLQTARGFKFDLDDLTGTGQLYIDNLLTLTRYARHITNEYVLAASTSTTVKTPTMHVQALNIKLGSSARDPVVRKSDLDRVVKTIMTWANAHVHGRSPPASPSLTVTTTASAVTFSR